MMTTKIGSTYEHYKGKKYRIIALAHHSETLEEMVVYECLYNNPLGKIWVRPRKMFEEKVSVEGKVKDRFKKIAT